MKKYIIAIDQGTTGSRAVVFDKNGRQAAAAYQEFPQMIGTVIIHDSKINEKSSKINECMQQPRLSHMHFSTFSLFSIG